MLADRFVMADVQVMEFVLAVITDQSRGLLEMRRLELHFSFGAVAMGLLVARHQRLGEQAADAFAATEAQITGPRGQALAGNHSDTTFSPPGEKAPSA